MKGLALAPGRGFLLSGTEVQLGCVGTDPSGEGQARALAELGAHLAERWAPVPPLAPVPVDVALDSVRASSDGGVVLGVDALTLAPATVDLGDVPTFLIAGPDRSGRSTALGSLARGVVRTGRMTGCYLVAPRRTPLTEALEWSGVARADDAGALAERVVAELDEGHGLVLVVIDDGDEVADGPAATGLDRMVRRGRDGGLVLLASAQSHVLHRTFAGWLTDARKSKQGLVLGPDVEIDGDLFGVRLPRRAHRTFPPGRGYLVSRGTTRLVQVAR